MKENGTSKVDERRDAIAKLVNQQGYASLEQLAELHEVSTQTIRRDIQALSDANRVIRHHGGAGSASSVVNVSYNVRRISLLDEKRKLAQTATKLIRPGHSMFMTGGSTMEIVAQEIAQMSTLCVITNNIHAAFHLYSNKEIDLIMPAGRVRHHNGGIIGPSAMEFVTNFQADYMLMSIGAVSEDGFLLDYDFEEAMLMRQMMSKAREVILVTDNSKFGHSAIAQVGHLRDVACLVTDKEPPEKIHQILAEHNIRLIIPED